MLCTGWRVTASSVLGAPRSGSETGRAWKRWHPACTALPRRRTGASVEFLLAHPGGPFWRRRDEGAWSIPKGLVGEGEAPLAAAVREFEEEVGLSVAGDFIALTPRRQNPGKLVHCWMVEADL